MKIKYLFSISLVLFVFTIFCQNKPKQLSGVWDNKAGQALIFKQNNDALWLFDNGTAVDTFKIKYHFDPTTNPNHFDLYDFPKGPLVGKSLYGIIEFTDDNAFKCDCEPGNDSSVRPADFDPQDTQIYYKKVTIQPTKHTKHTKSSDK